MQKRSIKDDKQKTTMLTEQLLQEKLAGDKDRINPDVPINQQIEVLPYNLKKYEIEREKFTIGRESEMGNLEWFPLAQ